MGFMAFDASLEILEHTSVEPVGVEKRALTDSLGRVLAEDIVARENSPAYPTSAMDGYAIIGADQERITLEVTQINPAGNDAATRVVPGCAVKTFTGALMPEGSDTLIPIENVTYEAGKITINEAVPAGYSVRPVGENFREGEALVTEGSRIGFAEIGVMASLNVVAPLVRQRPRVAILATGSEVLELGECSGNAAQIRSSNNYTIEALVAKHGGEPVQLGAVGDRRDWITKAMRQALASADIVVTTGGVSVGDFDFVKDVIRDDLGCELLFKGVRIKPGQHIMAARKGNKFIVALPGFAYSSTVTFLLYVLPLLYRMQGIDYRPPVVLARLKDGYARKSRNKAEFAACNLSIEAGEFVADFEGKRSGSSAILTNLLGECGLLWLDEDEGGKEAGERVRVLRL